MNYHNITHDDMNNGDGLRTVLWVAGCSHHCYNCQNPETHDACGGIKFDGSAYEELINSLKPDYISGITFSGGDPLHVNNIRTVTELAKTVKDLGKTVWLYTGSCWEYLYMKHKEGIINILNYVDVLVDGEYIDHLRDINLKWRGSSNQRVIDVQASLKYGKCILHCD